MSLTESPVVAADPSDLTPPIAPSADAKPLETLCSFLVDPEDAPPMMQQFLGVKQQYPGVMLLYQMGDFYETFFEDALTAARALDITLTARDAGKLGKVPMAGVPIRNANAYIEKLLAQQFKVAICQQVSDPAASKGLVERRVTRVLSQGTMVETDFLPSEENNYLACVAQSKTGWGLAWCDASVGQFYTAEYTDVSLLADELGRIMPKELLVAGQWQKGAITKEYMPVVMNGLPQQLPYSAHPQVLFTPSTTTEAIEQYFNIQSLESFGLSPDSAATCASGAILQYLRLTFIDTELPPFERIQYIADQRNLYMNQTTRNSLELLQTSRHQDIKGSLFAVLNKTLTPMGARLLREWLVRPSADLTIIHQRLNAVEALMAQGVLGNVQQLLPQCCDLERLSVKLTNQSIQPRELLGIYRSAAMLPQLAQVLSPLEPNAVFAPMVQLPQAVVQLAEIIERAIADDAPLALKEGGIFKPGYDTKLDEMLNLLATQEAWKTAFEEQERERTGLRNLKVGFHTTFGYYIEISKSQAPQAPVEYTRKQTLVNAERFITPELKAFETRIMEAEGGLRDTEYQLYVALKNQLAPYGPLLKQLAQALAQLDVIQSFATVSQTQRYVKPIIDDGFALDLVDARHPIIEQQLPLGQFVPNQCLLSAESASEHPQLLVITGPNMAGKSTYMRQVALCVIMAQMGCFVPASYARLGLVDKLYTRIGAVDDISQGQSTFMVEMVEVAELLHGATPHSLVILDEIGRGTSTFDGISIAWSIAEHLMTHNKCRGLFATHYHELNTLESLHPKIQNVRVLVSEADSGDIRFLYQVAPGAAQKSYGIQVAKMAGLPQGVVVKAQSILSKMQRKDLNLAQQQNRQLLQQMAQEDQLNLFGG